MAARLTRSTARLRIFRKPERASKCKIPFPFRTTLFSLDPKNFSAYESTVKWRKGSEMGLSFDEQISLEDESNPRVKILRRVSMQARAS